MNQTDLEFKSIKNILRSLSRERAMLILLNELSFKKLFEYYHSFRDLQMAASTTNTLLMDLMDFAKIQNRTFKLKKEFFNLNELI